MSKRTPTPQQVSCIAASVDDSIKMLKIEAAAGAGKTSTLTMMAEAVPVPSLYLAFNKVTATEATEKFPRHVTCQTTHSVAYAAFGRKMANKLKRPQGRYVNVAGTGAEIGRYYRIDPLEHAREIVLSSAFLGLLVRITVARFEQSADWKLALNHVPYSELKEKQKTCTFSMDIAQQTILHYAHKLWEDRISLSSPVLATHDTYLKMYQLSKPVMAGYDVLYVDEFQDTSPCVLDIVLRQREHMKVVMVGDSRQAIYCQPAGTMVKVVTSTYSRSRVTEYADVPIELISVGTPVVAYSVGRGHMYKGGKPVSKVGIREFSGTMLTVAVGGKTTKYTADHHVVVRLGDYNKGRQVVYLMKKGDKFRVGIAPWQYAGGMFGLGQRASAEAADAAWVLGLHDSYVDALMQENIVSYKYGIPQICFKDRREHVGQLNGTLFWEQFGNNEQRGLAVLRDFGLLADYPLWGAKLEDSMCKTKMRSSFVTAACNLTNGMTLAVMDSEQIKAEGSHGRLGLEYWLPIDRIEKVTVSGEKVYSLEVADAHTYFADDVLTHNCWRGAVNALGMVEAPTRSLTKSFRYGQAVADIATAVLQGAMKIEGNETIKSVVGFTDKVDKSRPHTRLFRTNAALLSAAIGEIRKGTKVSVEIDVKDFVKLLQSAVALRNDDKKNAKHDKVLPHNDWAELVEEAKHDAELGRVARVVNDGEAESWIETLEGHTNSSYAHVTFTTAHKSKGREFSQVIVEGDFKSAMNEDGEFVGLSEEEQNLLYVACTRAIDVLEYNKTVTEYLRYGQREEFDYHDVAEEYEA